MEDSGSEFKQGAFKEHEKFYGFLALLVAVIFLAYMSGGEQTYVMVDGKPVSVANGLSLRDALIGLIGILGAASQALFRTNENAPAMNHILSTLVKSAVTSQPQTPVPASAIEAADTVAEAAQNAADAIDLKGGNNG